MLVQRTTHADKPLGSLLVVTWSHEAADHEVDHGQQQDDQKHVLRLEEIQIINSKTLIENKFKYERVIAVFDMFKKKYILQLEVGRSMLVLSQL